MAKPYEADFQYKGSPFFFVEFQKKVVYYLWKKLCKFGYM